MAEQVHSGVIPVSRELVIGLKCRLCGKQYPKEALNFCTDDFGPLEVAYDYDEVARTMTRQAIERGPARCGATASCCRSTASRPSAGTSAARRWSGPTGWPGRSASPSSTSRTTPSIIPTLSFKDRVVAVALSKAVELGFQTVGCASTGNLANSVAANAAAAGLEAYVLIPDGLEQGKVLGATIYGAKVDRHRGQLRPGQPALLADRLPLRLGIRQRQPPAVLRRGLEDRSASRSPKTWAGGRPTTSSRRWPAAA